MDESNKFLVPLAIVVAGGLIAGAVYFGGKTPTPRPGSGQATEIQVPPVTEKDHILGSRNAELIIVEYSDTECPFCKVFHNTMKEVVSSYNGKVAWVYRQLPIVQLHSKAPKEAEALECVASLAGNQAFWTYLDLIFETTNSNDSLDPAELPRLAISIGVSEQAFNECLNSDRFSELVQKQTEEGYKAGARGTPYSLVLDQKGEVKTTINGAEPLANIKAKLDALLR